MSIEDVIAVKRVMRQSLFAEEPLMPEVNLVAAATASHASRLLAYAFCRAGTALLVALLPFAVALLKSGVARASFFTRTNTVGSESWRDD